MPTMILDSFSDLLAPVTVPRFRRDHLDRAPLHVPGPSDKYATVMSWDGLNRLLDMTAIWSDKSLQLALDRRMIPAERYCRRTQDRDGRPVLRPEPSTVRRLLDQGASLLLNDIDTLSPGLRRLADRVEGATGGKVQINLYCSWRERQAFDSHFDTHDVYALQIAGQKRWTVYQGRLDQPIANPAFKTLGQAYHDTAKGMPQLTVELQPGDLLYVPRGQYHDALATGKASIHLAVGVTQPIGIDVVNLLFEQALADPLFRRRLPEAAMLAGHLDGLAARTRGWLGGPDFRRTLDRALADFHCRRGGFPGTPGFRASSVKP